MDGVRSRRARLEHDRSQVVARLEALGRELDEIVESAQLANVDDEHDPDGSTIAYERAKVIALLTAAGQDLDAIDAALARADDPTFAMCRSCGAPIGDERLDLLPATTTCVVCAAR